MKFKERIALGIIIGILLALVVFLYSRDLSYVKEVDKYETKIIELQTQINIVEVDIEPLHNLIENYKVQILELDNLAKQKDLQILKLNEDVKNIGSMVDNMGRNDFTRFFSSRYNVSMLTYPDSSANN